MADTVRDDTQDLTVGSIPVLVRRLAIPASVGFFFNTMYNVVDTFYAGLVSTQALAALSLSFPVFFLIIAFAYGLSTGATALISNLLGAGKREEAVKYTAQTIVYATILSIALTIFGFLSAPFLFRLLGASKDYLSMSLDYINVIYYGAIFFVLSFILNAPLNAVGNTKPYRNFLIFGFFLNLILNPLFMFGWIGFPALGLSGIALATVVIEILGCVYLGYNLVKSDLINAGTVKFLLPEPKAFKQLTQQGFPASMNMVTVAVGVFVITYFVSRFGKEAVAAYGIATRIEQIALLPTIGLNIATLSMVGQNIGAKKCDRVKETLNTTLKYGAFVVLFGTFFLLIFSKQLMGLFAKDAVVVEIGSTYLKIAAFLLWSYVIMFINISALQGMKRPMFALWVGLGRQIVAPIALFSLFVYVIDTGLLGIWWGIFGINWTAAIISMVYARRIMNQETEAIG